MYEEIIEGNNKDDLTIWARKTEVEMALLLQEDVVETLVSQVIDNNYAIDLTDDEVEKLGRDPFLIAYALRDKVNRCIVTTEVSKPSKLRANRHIPDVCNSNNIIWCNTFKFINELDFSTNWKTRQEYQKSVRK